MKRLPFIGLLLQPTLTSLIITIVLSGLLVTVSSIIYATKSGQLFEFLFGTKSSITLIQETRNSIEAFNETLFSSPLLNQILLFVFWMLVGLILYSIISSIAVGLNNAREFYDKSHYVNIQLSKLKANLFRRIFLRIAALLAWILFSIFFFRTLLPFSLLANRIGVTEIGSWGGIRFIMLGFIVLAVSIHLHIVLLRLTLLRPRVIGGWEDILPELEQNSKNN